MKRQRVLIMGAAGRDFHNFNCLYRDQKAFEVVGFTAAQIPDIDGRKYPAKLAGKLYPKGVPIFEEAELTRLIRKLEVDTVLFSYSDVPHEHVMHMASIANTAGANFMMAGARDTMLVSRKPVIAVCAVRTGAGKSQTTRRVCEILTASGKRVVAVRHPMPYGNLSQQVCQRFATYEDLDRHHCTIEEREEYEPHLDRGTIVYAGVDYERILRQAEQEADVVVWDGGNNDTPFFRPDLHITVLDPLRPGHELEYHPGETNFRMADVLVINKMCSADPEDVAIVYDNIRQVRPDAVVVEAASPITVEDPKVIAGHRVLVVEDGPTLTHGGMTFGAGVVAAQKFGASALVDPRPFLKGTLVDTFRTYPEIGTVLPAMGYSDEQVKDLQATINASDADSVVIATPIDLRRLVKIRKPCTRVGYDLQEIGQPDLKTVIDGMRRRRSA
jgi:predicted GTPase